MITAHILLGGNLGDRHANLDQAIALIEQELGSVRARSSRVETAPWGFDHPNDFLNQALAVETELAPNQLLQAMLDIEQRIGRIRTSTPGYDARLIDIDLLLYGAAVIDEPNLQVPHPRMAQRWFALAPLAEIAATVQHPVLQQNISALLANCPQPDEERQG